MIPLLLAFLAAQATAPNARITGTFSDALLADGMTMFKLRASPDRDLPGVADGDQVFKVTLPQFRPPGARSGLLVAYVASATGSAMFVDANLDGRLVEKERIPYTAGATADDAREVQVDIASGVPKAPPLPFRCRVVSANRVSMVSTVKAFLAERRVDWPNASPASVKDLIRNQFRTMGFQTMILLDPEGRVLAVAGDAHLIIPIVQRALAKR